MPARAAAADARPAEKVFVTNRKAFHDYHILESIEAGIAPDISAAEPAEPAAGTDPALDAAIRFLLESS